MSEDGSAKKPKTGDVEAFDLVPCLAMCCCIYSLYTEIPDCCGSVCENTFMCCNCKTITCKPSKESGVFCKFFSCDWDFVAATTCCTSRSQAFCLDIRAACPPTGDFPCLVTLCCITCIYDYKCVCACCIDVSEIDAKASGGKTQPYQLEQEWAQKVDPQTQQVFYENKTTGETRWEKPI
eukprot:gene8681-9564_t